MPALTPEFLFDFESNMRAITENEYARFSANMWWSRFMRTMPSSSSKEIVAWLLSTAQIESLDKMGGHLPFEDLAAKYTTFENKYAGAGLKLQRRQLEDLDGGGLDLAAKWSTDIGAQMSYWPQKQLVTLLKNGHLTTGPGGAAYDGLAFFHASHPVNPFNDGAGTYSNLITANDHCIDETVTVDVALKNLAKVIALIKAFKMPNGEDPRFLRPVALIVPPAMQTRAVQLTNAKFIAQAAASGGGGGDVEAVITSMGFTQPVVADELAGFESDATYFVACEDTSSQLGSFVYVDREPFKITYYTGKGGGTGVDAILDRAEELEWHCKGRNGIGYGHPYTFVKVDSVKT